MFTNQEKNAPLKMCVKENVYLFNKRTKKLNSFCIYFMLFGYILFFFSADGTLRKKTCLISRLQNVVINMLVYTIR